MSRTSPALNSDFDRVQEVPLNQAPETGEGMIIPGQIAQTLSIVTASEPRRAYICAPFATDTRIIRQVLADRGMVPTEWEDLAQAGSTFEDAIADDLRQADIVVVVLDEGSTNGNVLFEAGYAAALKKRILWLVPPGQMVPFPASAYLRVAPNNKEAIEFGLDQVMRAPTPTGVSRPLTGSRTRPIGPLADDLLARLRFSDALTERELISLLAEAFQATGVPATSQRTEERLPGGRVDLAIWVDEIDPLIRNPLPIKVGQHFKSVADIGQAATQLGRLLGQTPTDWGLLIYHSDEDRPLRVDIQDSRVLVTSVASLLEVLRTTSLADLILGLRDERVRGGD